MKIDYTKTLGSLYQQPKKEISILEVPAMNFLTIRGRGDPNGSAEYSQAVGALYSLAYALKFAIKKGPQAIDYAVLPLEGLWWAEDMRRFNLEDRSEWLWQMMIMQAEYVTQELFTRIVEEVHRKKNPPKLDEVRFERFEEGLCAQVFHAGPYGEAERPTTDRLHAFISAQGYEKTGKHHEIYFNSPLRSAPDKLKTIIRQPIRKAGANA
jgi:hypothetical protein